MQALEFKRAIIRHMQDRRNRMRVMRGELRIDPVCPAQQLARIGKVGHIRSRLGREHRKAIKTLDLRTLDLAIPISALNQPHHHPTVMSLRHVVDRINHGTSARSIGLHYHAEPIPAHQSRFRQNT